MSILLQEEKDGVAVLTMNRPEAMNSLSSELSLALQKAVKEIGGRRDIRAVIITGAGDRAFCAGADLKERRDLDAEGKWQQRAHRAGSSSPGASCCLILDGKVSIALLISSGNLR